MFFVDLCRERAGVRRLLPSSFFDVFVILRVPEFEIREFGSVYRFISHSHSVFLFNL